MSDIQRFKNWSIKNNQKSIFRKVKFKSHDKHIDEDTILRLTDWWYVLCKSGETLYLKLENTKVSLYQDHIFISKNKKHLTTWFFDIHEADFDICKQWDEKELHIFDHFQLNSQKYNNVSFLLIPVESIQKFKIYKSWRWRTKAKEPS